VFCVCVVMKNCSSLLSPTGETLSSLFFPKTREREKDPTRSFFLFLLSKNASLVEEEQQRARRQEAKKFFNK